MSKTVAVVLAAGQGTRMKSEVPKVLHLAAGRPLLYYPVRAALDAGVDEVVVVVSPKNQAMVESSLGEHLAGAPLKFAVQEQALGTGHAAKSGLRALTLQAEDRVLILSGDTPLLEAKGLSSLLSEASAPLLRFYSFVLAEPGAYGRVLRGAEGEVQGIVEFRDLSGSEQLSICEVNGGAYLAKAGPLLQALEALRAENNQGEYYLTDVVATLAALGRVEAVQVSPELLAGVNHRGELAQVERCLHERIALAWAEKGITVHGRVLVDDTVQLGLGVSLEDGVRLRGKTRVGEGSQLDVGVLIDNSEIGAGVQIKAYTVIVDSLVEEGAQLGPFAHLRPGSSIGPRAHLGNFVETKNTRLQAGAKANHLSYLGDGEVGEGANIGAGTIFCNYDGYRKQKTVIGPRAFIGSDSQLVAPVHIGEDAYVATGTTVTRDVPSGGLAIGRTKQENKPGYGLLLRERLKRLAAEAKAKLKSSP